MILSEWLVLGLSLTEILLLCLVAVFFWRLRASEALLSKLRDKQEELLNKLRFNAQLEQELVSSFASRQAELVALDGALAKRSAELTKILKQAEDLCRSPRFLREVVAAAARQGRTPAEIARETGLSVEEVELLLEQARGR
jgi:uncharacterized protein HemX